MRYLPLLLIIVVIIIVARVKAKKRQQLIDLYMERHYVERHIYPAISQREFAILAKQAARKIKRVSSLTVRDTDVYGEVTSQSGISTWEFSLHFGPIERLDGEWYKYSDNYDSDIPERIANSISEAIKAYPNVYIDPALYYAFCPYCGKRLPYKGDFCTFCGEKFQE